MDDSSYRLNFDLGQCRSQNDNWGGGGEGGGGGTYSYIRVLLY